MYYELSLGKEMNRQFFTKLDKDSRSGTDNRH